MSTRSRCVFTGGTPARENPEGAATVESHPFGFAQGRLLRKRPRKDRVPGHVPIEGQALMF